MEKLVIGLVEGRHTIKNVERFIFSADFIGTEENMSELFNRLYSHAFEVLIGYEKVDLFVTGFTAALTAVVRVCVENNIALTCHHFDRATTGYAAQVVITEQQAACQREADL